MLGSKIVLYNAMGLKQYLAEKRSLLPAVCRQSVKTMAAIILFPSIQI